MLLLLEVSWNEKSLIKTVKSLDILDMFVVFRSIFTVQNNIAVAFMGKHRITRL